MVTTIDDQRAPPSWAWGLPDPTMLRYIDTVARTDPSPHIRKASAACAVVVRELAEIRKRLPPEAQEQLTAAQRTLARMRDAPDPERIKSSVAAAHNVAVRQAQRRAKAMQGRGRRPYKVYSVVEGWKPPLRGRRGRTVHHDVAYLLNTLVWIGIQQERWERQHRETLSTAAALALNFQMLTRSAEPALYDRLMKLAKFYEEEHAMKPMRALTRAARRVAGAKFQALEVRLSSIYRRAARASKK